MPTAGERAASPAISTTASRAARTNKPATPSTTRTPTRPSTVKRATSDEEAKLQARMQELQSKLQEAEDQRVSLEKQRDEADRHAAVFQVKVDESSRAGQLLEEQLHESIQRVEALTQEKQGFIRTCRDLEQQLKDKHELAISSQHEELITENKQLKELLLRKNSAQDEHLAEDGDLAAVVAQKESLIQKLQFDLAEAQIHLVEVDNKGSGLQQKLEREISELKIANAQLLEEKESFRLLLNERAFSGNLPTFESASQSTSNTDQQAGNSLADELNQEELDHDGTDSERRLRKDLKDATDQNKALTLYINNIVSRAMDHPEFAELILNKSDDASSSGPSKEKALPAPPPTPPIKDQAQQVPADAQGGLLQRARSVMGGGLKRRPAAVSAVNSQNDLSSVHENPSTAPRIPLGRSASTRVPSVGHQRISSDFTATASLREGLRSPPATRTSFGLGNTIAEGEDENRNPRDARLNPPSRGQVDGATTDSADSETAGPSSPPRSTTSSGERDARASGGVMIGSRPRPLRLLQDPGNQDTNSAANKRASWFGWMNGQSLPATAGATGSNVQQ